MPPRTSPSAASGAATAASPPPNIALLSDETILDNMSAGTFDPTPLRTALTSIDPQGLQTMTTAEHQARSSQAFNRKYPLAGRVVWEVLSSVLPAETPVQTAVSATGVGLTHTVSIEQLEAMLKRACYTFAGHLDTQKLFRVLDCMRVLLGVEEPPVKPHAKVFNLVYPALASRHREAVTDMGRVLGDPNPESAVLAERALGAQFKEVLAMPGLVNGVVAQMPGQRERLMWYFYMKKCYLLAWFGDAVVRA